MEKAREKREKIGGGKGNKKESLLRKSYLR